MHGVRIVTDSAADLPRELAEKLGIIIMPIRVILGGSSFRDGIDLPPQEFADAPGAGIMPSTSQPSPWDFKKLFSELVSQGEEVLCLTLSAGLSGTYQSAVIAASQTAGKIRVVDSQLVSAGLGLLVTRVAAQADESNLDQLAQWANSEKTRIRAFAALDNVEPIVRGGRTSLFARHAAGTEGIKLIFTFNERGGIQILERVRGRKRSLERLTELINEKDCPQAAVVHVDCSGEAGMVARSIAERRRAEILYVQEAGGTVRTYAGRGAVIVAG